MQTDGQRKASRAVDNWLAANGRSNAWLIASARADKGTVGTFLSGETWPRRTTLARIEKALGWSVGTITGIADGAADVPKPHAAPSLAAATAAQLLTELGRRMGLVVSVEDQPPSAPPRKPGITLIEEAPDVLGGAGQQTGTAPRLPTPPGAAQ